ncbi:MAG: arginine repressor [Clostridia bacterium]|nr:arginine repressor [Clostridia bacterium]
MARNIRQSKIISIISNSEIETQEELVSALRADGFDITQATISRDIKELGLIKIVGKVKKYKYAFIDTEEKVGTNKTTALFKEAVLSVKGVNNLVVLKTVKGTASMVSSFLDKLAIDDMLGCVFGEDTVMAILDQGASTENVVFRINEVLTGS